MLEVDPEKDVRTSNELQSAKELRLLLWQMIGIAWLIRTRHSRHGSALLVVQIVVEIRHDNTAPWV